MLMLVTRVTIWFVTSKATPPIGGSLLAAGEIRVWTCKVSCTTLLRLQAPSTPILF